MSNQSTPGATAPDQKTAGTAAPGAALSRKQRDALFDAAAAGMTPEQERRKPADPAQKWAPQIIRKYKQGFSAAQIAKMASAPGIGIEISVRAVGRIIAAQATRKAKRASAARG